VSDQDLVLAAIEEAHRALSTSIQAQGGTQRPASTCFFSCWAGATLWLLNAQVAGRLRLRTALVKYRLELELPSELKHLFRAGRRGCPMIADEVSGDGMIIIDGENVEIVYYWLTVVPKAGLVIAEGSISGSEEVMKKVKNAKTPKLMLVDGPTVALRCHGGRNGTRWVKAMRA
jgi:hypothetical protein